MYPYPHDNHRPRIVAIEGIDGAGKTALAKQLVHPLSEFYEKLAITAIYRISQRVRPDDLRRQFGPDMDPIAMELILAGHRRDQWTDVLNQGAGHQDLVIIDRWIASAMAYHAGEDFAWVASIHASVPMPDVTLLLDVEVDLALDRKGGDADQLMRARERYKKLLREAHPALGRCYVVDAHQRSSAVLEDCVSILRKEQIL